jgi:hypothetical protein
MVLMGQIAFKTIKLAAAGDRRSMFDVGRSMFDVEFGQET